MAVTAKREVRTLTLRQRKGRAVNAVAEMLRKRLSVPNIYLEPNSRDIAADVFAVDRAGAGDLHAVQIRLDRDFDRNPASPTFDPSGWMLHVKELSREIVRHLVDTPAHFKYLAITRESWDLLAGEFAASLYSPDGIGRIGIIQIVERGDDPPIAELSIAPERFRVDPVKLGNIEKKLLQKVRPDIEVRI